MKNKISRFADKNFIHRGYFNNIDIPENSIIAFSLALKRNFNIELDVQLTKDNELVVFHDYSLKRMCGNNKLVENCTYEELNNYNLLNTKYKIPLLKDVLKLINGKVNLLIETKVKNYNGKLERELSKILDNYKGIFGIQSFNYLSINWFKRNRKNYIIGLLISKLKIKDKLVSMYIRPDFISYNIKYLPNKYISKIKKRKLIFGWTFRDIEEVKDKEKYCNIMIYEKNILKKL